MPARSHEGSPVPRHRVMRVMGAWLLLKQFEGHVFGEGWKGAPPRFFRKPLVSPVTARRPRTVPGGCPGSRVCISSGRPDACPRPGVRSGRLSPRRPRTEAEKRNADSATRSRSWERSAQTCSVPAPGRPCCPVFGRTLKLGRPPAAGARVCGGDGCLSSSVWTEQPSRLRAAPDGAQRTTALGRGGSLSSF